MGDLIVLKRVGVFVEPERPRLAKWRSKRKGPVREKTSAPGLKTRNVMRGFRPVSAEHQRHQAIFSGAIPVNGVGFVPLTEGQQACCYGYGQWRRHCLALQKAEEKKKLALRREAEAANPELRRERLRREKQERRAIQQKWATAQKALLRLLCELRGEPQRLP